eukprot:5349198-Pyramimonas_sp.AAC.1
MDRERGVLVASVLLGVAVCVPDHLGTEALAVDGLPGAALGVLETLPAEPLAPVEEPGVAVGIVGHELARALFSPRRRAKSTRKGWLQMASNAPNPGHPSTMPEHMLKRKTHTLALVP